MVLWTSRQNRQRVQICHRKTHCMAKPNAKEDYWVKSKCVPFIGPCQRYANKRARRNKRFIEDEDKEKKAILEVRHEQASRQTGNKEVGEGRA